MMAAETQVDYIVIESVEQIAKSIRPCGMNHPLKRQPHAWDWLQIGSA